MDDNRQSLTPCSRYHIVLGRKVLANEPDEELATSYKMTSGFVQMNMASINKKNKIFTAI